MLLGLCCLLRSLAQNLDADLRVVPWLIGVASLPSCEGEGLCALLGRRCLLCLSARKLGAGLDVMRQ